MIRATQELQSSSSSCEAVSVSLNGSLTQCSAACKLQFPSLSRLYGRERECQQLKEAWEEILSEWKTQAATISIEDQTDCLHSWNRTSMRRLITILGEAGSGKTRLAMSIRDDVTGKGGLFLEGKFPQQFQSTDQGEPFSAFALVCSDLCQLIHSSTDKQQIHDEELTSSYNSLPNQSHNVLRERLDREMSSDKHILNQVIPALIPLFLGHEELEKGVGNADDSTDCTTLQKQFIFSFRKLIRCITSVAPLVIFLDDVQWADMASMQLLEALLTDYDTSSLLVMGCIRSEAEYANSPFFSTIQAIRNAEHDRSGLDIDSIITENLEPAHIRELLVDILSLPDSQVGELADCIHSKTNGNIFFVIHFIKSLQESDLLTYRKGEVKGTFDFPVIEESTRATDNVVNLVKAKFKRLPASVIRSLPLMACLGSTFDASIFELVFKHQCLQKSASGGIVEGSVVPSDAMKHLAICKNRGLLETRIGYQRTYRWIHDKIQEAAVGLISEKAFSELMVSIGEVLHKNLDQITLEKNLFLVASLLLSLNCDTISFKVSITPLDLSRLFLRAGAKALERSSFDLASEYIDVGIKFLPEAARWQTHWILARDVLSTAAEVKFIRGHLDQTRLLCYQVIDEESLSLLEKRRSYNVLIRCTFAERGQRAAFDLCMSLLAKLGCTFPKLHSLNIGIEVARVKLALRDYSNSKTTRDLPLLENQKVLWTISLLAKSCAYAYASNPTLFPLIIIKACRMTLRFGVSEYAPLMFAYLGMVFAIHRQDYETGKAIGLQAIHLLTKLKSDRRARSQVLLLYNAFVLHWSQPASLTVKPLHSAYTLGMECGETECASFSIYFYLLHSFLTGKRIQLISEECDYYSISLRQVKQQTILIYVSALWQAVLLISGKNHFTGSLTGDVIQQEVLFRSDALGDFDFVFLCIQKFLIQVAFLMGRHDVVYDSIVKTGLQRGSLEKRSPGVLQGLSIYLFSGLSMISLYRTSSRKKYLKLAKYFAVRVRRYWRRGNPNALRFALLLEAELSSISVVHNHTSISRQYKDAIRHSELSGPNTLALAHELYGEYLFRRGIAHEAEASFNLEEAVRHYDSWGATAKVKLLQEMYTVTNEGFIATASKSTISTMPL